MKRYIKCFLLACLSMFSLLSKSQDFNTSDSLPVLKIANEQLLVILDSLIEYDKRCDFYDSNLVYIVHIQPTEYTTLIQFTSSHKLIKTGNETGCLAKKGHFIVVRGISDDTHFEKTRCKKIFNYYQPSDGIDSNGTVIIDIYEDDSYTQWDYKYNKGSFTKI